MFRRTLVISVLILAMASVTMAAEWQIDKAHSSVGFTVRHLVIAKVSGQFTDFDGKFVFDTENLGAGTVEMTVAVESVNTNDTKRDDHLRSPDFFDAANFPQMTFKSKSVHDVDGDNFKITGDLTIRDVTKEVTFDATFNGVMVDPWGNTKSGFSATTKIDRQDFNVKWNKSLDAGGVVVGDEVTINLELELAAIK